MKKNKKVYIIAEVGPNHNGSYKLARKYIQMLAGSGVDAIKFQISDPQMALSLNSFRAKYEKNAKGYKSKVNLFDEVKKGQLGRDEHAKLSKECKKFKLDYLKIQRRIKVTRERDVAAALQLIGGIRKRGCPVEGVGDNVNVWVIRNHDKYKNHTAKELGKEYVGFYTDSSHN